MIASNTFTLRDYQVEAVERSVRFLRAPIDKHGLAICPTGCHAEGTEILMVDGSIRAVESIQVGEFVMGPDSRPREVLVLCRGRDEMYQITPHRGGLPFVVNGDHVLSLVSTNEGRKAVRPCYQRGGERCFISVADYIKKAKSWKHLRKLHRSQPIEFRGNTLSIPPWILGVILGDGSTTHGNVSITSADKEIISEITQFARAWWLGLRIATKGNNNRAVGLHLTKRDPRWRTRTASAILIALRTLGLTELRSEAKFIPGHYKTATITERLELLAGLIDTDGHHDGLGGYDFISKSQRLAADVAFVARSLGFAVNVTMERKYCQTGNGGIYHRLHISGDTNRIPCRIKRKKAPQRLQKKNWLVTGFSVTAIGHGAFYGFQLGGDHLYLTADFTVHHNSGKSLIIANIVKELDAPSLVFQPSREILKQNFAKLVNYGFRPAIFSASLGKKQTSGAVTLATIGSVVRKPELFDHIKYVLVDECHLVNAGTGMYKSFFEALEHQKLRILGLTATPYRLTSTMEGPILKFLTRTRPRVFSEVVYYVQNGRLFQDGHLAKLQYYPIKGFDRSRLQTNSTGADYTDASVQKHFREMDFAGKLQRIVERLIEINRKGVLVFTRFVDEAQRLVDHIPGAAIVSALTPDAERDRILKEFRAGKIQVVANSGVLTTGFDYPELDTIVMARPTLSLGLYYQIVGRCVRPHPSKEYSMIVDMVGCLDQFGKVEDLRIECDKNKLWYIASNGRPLTNILFSHRGH